MNKQIGILFFVSLLFVLAFWGLGNALMPFLISFAMAYGTFPLVQKLEKKGVSRKGSILSVFLFLIVLVALIMMLVLPVLLREAEVFFKESPFLFTSLLHKIEVLLKSWGYEVHLSADILRELLQQKMTQISGDALRSSFEFLKNIFSNLFGGLLLFFNLSLIPLFYYHLINQYEIFAKEFHGWIPRPWRRKAMEYLSILNGILSGYLRGQLMVSFSLAFLYSLGFLVINLKFGLLLGVLTGALSVVPYLGSLFGFVTALLIAFVDFQGWGTVLGVAIVFFIVQGLEGFVLTPRLVGNKVGLGVLSTLLILIIGGNIFGFLGMILAIPIGAFLKTILRDLKKELHEDSLTPKSKHKEVRSPHRKK